MNNRPTPETDACIIERRKIHKSDGSVQLVELIDAEFARRLERERDEARAERDILRLNSLGTIQLNIPVTTDWKEETNDDHEQL